MAELLRKNNEGQLIVKTTNPTAVVCKFCKEKTNLYWCDLNKFYYCKNCIQEMMSNHTKDFDECNHKKVAQIIELK